MVKLIKFRAYATYRRPEHIRFVQCKLSEGFNDKYRFFTLLYSAQNDTA